MAKPGQTSRADPAVCDAPSHGSYCYFHQLTHPLAHPSLPPCLLCQESFVRAKNWVKELQRQASPNIVIALAGNKADLANKRALDFQVSVLSTRQLHVKPLKRLSERRWPGQTLKSLSFLCHLLPCGRFSLGLIISSDRMHSHTQTTTAYFSWRRLPKPP